MATHHPVRAGHLFASVRSAGAAASPEREPSRLAAAKNARWGVVGHGRFGLLQCCGPGRPALPDWPTAVFVPGGRVKAGGRMPRVRPAILRRWLAFSILICLQLAAVANGLAQQAPY